MLCAVAFFKVGEIVVENTAVRYTDEQIVAAAEVHEGDSLLRVNKKAVAARIEKALPYIGEVKIRTRLPGTLTITVEYTKAKLCVKQPEGYVLMDIRGKVLQTEVAQIPDYVALITGATVVKSVPGEEIQFLDPDTLTYVKELAAAFEEKGIGKLTALDLSDLGDVKAEIDYCVDVRFGAVTKVLGKLEFGKTVIDETLETAKNGGQRMVVDLSGDKSAYVRTKDNADASKEAASTVPADDASEQDVPSTEPGEDDDDDDDYDYDYDYDDDDDDEDYDYDDEDEDYDSEGYGDEYDDDDEEYADDDA